MAEAPRTCRGCSGPPKRGSYRATCARPDTSLFGSLANLSICDQAANETPGAYKPIDAVMEAQSDLVEILHTLRQVVCVKG